MVPYFRLLYSSDTFKRNILQIRPATSSQFSTGSVVPAPTKAPSNVIIISDQQQSKQRGEQQPRKDRREEASRTSSLPSTPVQEGDINSSNAQSLSAAIPHMAEQMPDVSTFPPKATSQVRPVAQTPARFPDIQSFEQRQGGNIVIRDMREYQDRLQELQEQRKRLGQINDTTAEEVQKFSVLENNVHTQQATKEFLQEPPRRVKVSQSMEFPAMQRRLSGDTIDNSSGNLSSRGSTRAVSMENLSGSKSRLEMFTMDETERITYNPETESIVERERRLVRERDVAHRRAKGLELKDAPKSADVVEIVKVDAARNNTKPKKKVGDNSEKAMMRNYASGQLRNEIKQQRKREIDLKNEGKIRTTSEDHIDMPYVSRMQRQTSMEGLVDVRSAETVETTNASAPTSGDQVDAAPAAVVRRAKSTTENASERRKSSNPQESRIEAEIREMRQREEELRYIPCYTIL